MIYQTGQMLPDFRMPGIEGQNIRISDFRNRKNLVVIFLGYSNHDSILEEILRHQDALESNNAIVLLIRQTWTETPATIALKSNPVCCLLTDELGTAHVDAGADLLNDEAIPVVYILDRYGEIYASYPNTQYASYPGVQVILEWLQYMEIRCST